MKWAIPFDVIVAVDRSKAEPAPGELIQRHGAMCYACGQSNPDGLQLDFYAGFGVSAQTIFSIGQQADDTDGHVRPGILTAAILEAADHAHQQSGLPATAAKLSVDFAEPVPSYAAVKIEARLVGAYQDRMYVDVDVRTLGGREMVASALAVYERE